MTPKELIDLLEKNDITFENLYNEPEEYGMPEIGEIEAIDYNDYNEDDKRSHKEIIIHFKTLNFYIEECQDFIWGNLAEISHSVVEPVETKIVFGNNVLIKQVRTYIEILLINPNELKVSIYQSKIFDKVSVMFIFSAPKFRLIYFSVMDKFE